MRDVIESRWFAIVDLALVSVCALIWYIWPQVGGWLLLVAMLPWIVRVIFGLSPFRRTALTHILVLFLFTAAIGVWTTYDRTTGWEKFWIILGAVLLFYALAGQPRDNLWLVAGLICGLNALLAAYFLLINDWTIQSADIGALNQLALWWMGVRPNTSATGLHPNIAGGLLAAFAPFSIALGWLAWRLKSWRLGLFVSITSVIVIAGLLLASSRMALLALSIALGIWLLWMFSGNLADITSYRRSLVFTLAVLLGVLLTSPFVMLFPGGLLGLLGRLPGPEHTLSRLEIARHTLKLVADYPITGGGLASFPGLYSHYIQVIPFFFFGYSHNLFLDVGLEQGLLGLGAFLIILGISFRSLMTTQENDILRWAVLAGFFVVVIHGLADDALYGGRGTPLLLVLPGLAIALARREENKPGAPSHSSTWRRWAIVICALCLLILAYAFRKPLAAQWYANLGAVHMARYELADFPSGSWDERLDLAPLEQATDYFKGSLRQNPLNFTANHRMGLIAMQVRDFDSALTYLEGAYIVDPEHRGLRKVLGYCYVWTGQFEDAVPLLLDIQEARDELKIYSWWWERQGREDLSLLSVRMVEVLDRLEPEIVK